MKAADTPITAVRDYWDRRPCNIRHSTAPMGSERYYDEVEARKYFVEPHIPGFADFDRWKGADVLEIGCGIGTDTINFARAGATIDAIDVSGVSVGTAADRLRLFGLVGRNSVMTYDAERLSDMLSGPYDLIYSFGVIHHSPHPERILFQAAVVSRPGTTLKLMVYHRRSWKVAALLARHPLVALRARSIDAAVAIQSEAETGCPITYTYTRRQAVEMVGDAGFHVDEVRVEHIFPWRIADYVRYCYVRAWPWKVVPEPMFRWLEHRIGWHLLITATRESSFPC